MSTFKTNGILFDLDGTLWDSTSEIADAWNELIKIKGGVDRPPITKEELHGCMGLPMYSIAAKLFPNMPEQDRNDLMDEMGRLLLFQKQPGNGYRCAEPPVPFSPYIHSFSL